MINVYMDAQNKFLLEKIRIMEVSRRKFKKKEEKIDEKKIENKPAGQRVNRLNNSIYLGETHLDVLVANFASNSLIFFLDFVFLC